MKKIVSFVIAGVAMIGLSGCNLTNLDGGKTYTQVNIQDLTDGYLINGDDGSYKTIELSYCGNTYELYHEGTTFTGTFNVKSSTETINMFQKNPKKASYRIDTVNGFLEVGEKYTVKFNGYDITVTSIRKDSLCK